MRKARALSLAVVWWARRSRWSAAAGPASSPAAGRGEAGFTLVELAVATAVMLLALLLACDLLEESGKLLHHSARRARDPLPLLATELLRNDLRAAQPPPFSSPGLGWDHGPLDLAVPTGWVSWYVKGGALVRSDLTDARTMTRGVAGWGWRALPGAFEVELILRTSGDWLSQTRRGPPRPDAGREERIVIVVAGRGGRSEW
jgi:hypothetical protein